MIFLNNIFQQQHEHTNYSQVDSITLNEDEYRYVLNDTVDYNNIIPQYLENDVNDFMFANDSQILTNTTEYYNNNNNNNSSYALTNLDANVQNYVDSNNIMEFTDDFNQTQHDRTINCNSSLNQNSGQSVMTPHTLETFIINHSNLNEATNSDGYLNHDDYFYGNKFAPMKTIENTADYMFVSSEEIIDTANVILDLTNDEVEQILDDNFSTQVFDSIGASNTLQSSTQCNRTPKINIATNLTKTIMSPLIINDNNGKLMDIRSLETPTINLDAIGTMDIESVSSSEAITMNVPIAKKKSGRTKGARQISMYCSSSSNIFMDRPFFSLSSHSAV